METKNEKLVKRATPWNESEKLFLLECVKSMEEKIVGKFSDTITKNDRDKAWEKISELLRAQGFVNRTTDACAIQWRDLRSKRKETIANFLRQSSQSGT